MRDVVRQVNIGSYSGRAWPACRPAGKLKHCPTVQQQWQMVDKWERPGGGLQGKFGFHLPGRDQMGVSDFHFVTN